jgi:hypothetical protein
LPRASACPVRIGSAPAPLDPGRAPAAREQTCGNARSDLPRQRRRFAQARAPFISLDRKKRELLGGFKNPGRVWSQAAVDVHDHDFRSLADGVAIPYGVDDLSTNWGRITIGTSRNTPAFAAESMRRWWRREGRPRYPHASHLLSLAGNGGSNGAATALWVEVWVRETSRAASACTSPPVIIPRAPPSGIPPSVASFPRSANAGPVSRWSITPPSNASLARPAPPPGSRCLACSTRAATRKESNSFQNGSSRSAPIDTPSSRRGMARFCPIKVRISFCPRP